MPLLEIKGFNALIDNKTFFDQPGKSKQEAYEKLIEMSRIMAIQQEIYQVICIIKNIINSLVKIYQDKKIQAFLKKSFLQDNQKKMTVRQYFVLLKVAKIILNLFSLDSLIVTE